MKKSILLFMVFLLGTACFVQAQSPYKNSFGLSVGNMEALSFKTFPTTHFAISVDLGAKIVPVGKKSNLIWDRGLEINPNFMFEGNFTKGLYGLLGGGLSCGWDWRYYGTSNLYRDDYFKTGVNGIAGIEYKFNGPVAIQLDFRPGYAFLFAPQSTERHFDWSANLGLRYTF